MMGRKRTKEPPVPSEHQKYFSAAFNDLMRNRQELKGKSAEQIADAMEVPPGNIYALRSCDPKNYPGIERQISISKYLGESINSMHEFGREITGDTARELDRELKDETESDEDMDSKKIAAEIAELSRENRDLRKRLAKYEKENMDPQSEDDEGLQNRG
jgi:transcriptional regulator with XRE-family HTH domain